MLGVSPCSRAWLFLPSAPSVAWAVSVIFARVVPYFTPVPLAALRVDHPIMAFESATVSATGPLLISSDDPDCVVLEAVPALIPDDPVWALLLEGLDPAVPELAVPEPDVPDPVP